MRSKIMFLMAVVFFIPLLAISGQSLSPVGVWKTFDDSGKPTGFVRILENNGIYTGVVEKGLPDDDVNKICTECRDDRKGKKLIGMTIIKNVKQSESGFIGDEILDPFSGNTYRVKLLLKDGGNVLEVRGYLGISLFGRTQKWERDNNG